MELTAARRRAIKTGVEKIRTEQQKQNSLIQSLSESIHSNEMELQNKRQELREKEALEKQKEAAREEIGQSEKELKVRRTRGLYARSHTVDVAAGTRDQGSRQCCSTSQARGRALAAAP